MRILIDMNLSPDCTAIFARHGIEAVHWSTVGDPRAEDRVITPDWTNLQTETRDRSR